MSLNLSPGTLVHTIWFVGWDTGDLLAYVFKPSGEPWIGEYRVRYHTAEKIGDPFEEADEKSFYTYKANSLEAPPDKLVEAMEGICQLTVSFYAVDLFDKLEINGDGADAIRELEKQSWFFMKRINETEVTAVDGKARN